MNAVEQLIKDAQRAAVDNDVKEEIVRMGQLFGEVMIIYTQSGMSEEDAFKKTKHKFEVMSIAAGIVHRKIEMIKVPDGEEDPEEFIKREIERKQSNAGK